MAFGSQQWMYASGGFYPHEIDQSLRFDTNSYLTRTPSSAGNRKTWTWSAWVKRGNLPASKNTIFQQRDNSNNSDLFAIELRSNDILRVIDQTAGGGTTYLLDTTAVYRDTSAWYHITVAVDTTDTTAGNRVRLYVNGERQTSFSTANTWPLNHSTSVNTTARALIGATRPATTTTLSSFFNGYMAEVNFVDGQALDASYFGETKSGVWIPKEYEGTYGTNGFHLDFATRATDPIDASGNGNNWSSVNVVSTDWMLDSPTNNFATLNSIETNKATLSEGNLKWSIGSAYKYGQATIAIPPTGKYIIEGLFNTTPTNNNYNTIGVISTAAFSHLHTHLVTSGSGFYGINDAAGYGQTFVENGARQGSITVPSGTVIQALVDRDNNQLTFTKNGTLQTGTGSTIALPSDGTLWFLFGDYGVTGVANFGQDSSFAGTKTRQGNTDANGIGDFYYAPPAGFLALCTANLPDPAIDPSQDDIPADYFNPVLYTGNGTGQSITGVGFQPDWVWIKSRSDVDNNVLQDSVRGVTKQLFSNLTDAETSFTNGVTSFDSDGFTVATSNWSNENGQTRVAWNWKAGGSAVANTDGTIASQVSANTKAGFSIVTFTAVNGSSDVGHGLDKEPEILIHKGRSFSNGWYTFIKFIDGSVDYARLDTTTAFASSGTMAFNSTTFKDWYSSGDFVAYCFHSVEGFSKFGTYVGNSSEDGPFVYTGFRPAFVMWKNVGASENWYMVDTARDPHNESYHLLRSDLSNAEASGTVDGLDILSNGFKLKVAGGGWINASGNTFLYMAFAEMPFKYANAR